MEKIQLKISTVVSVMCTNTITNSKLLELLWLSLSHTQIQRNKYVMKLKRNTKRRQKTEKNNNTMRSNNVKCLCIYDSYMKRNIGVNYANIQLYRCNYIRICWLFFSWISCVLLWPNSFEKKKIIHYRKKKKYFILFLLQFDCVLINKRIGKNPNNTVEEVK